MITKIVHIANFSIHFLHTALRQIYIKKGNEGISSSQIFSFSLFYLLIIA